MRDRYLLTPADIKARDDAQEARDFRVLVTLLCFTLGLLVFVFAWAIWSIR